jgi:uncharacterized protein (DUF1810 family)
VAVADAADRHDLERFVSAQRDAYASAVAQLRAGAKTGHWMWFVFPQIAGLGQSAMSQRYAIASLDEARAYLAHPVLGPRIAECARILTELPGEDAEAILGGIDALKLRSSMTLFARASEDDSVYYAVLDQYFGGKPDPHTEARLG